MAPRPTKLTTSQLSSNENTQPKALPEAFKAWADGWSDITREDVAYQIELEDDFQDHELGRSLVETLLHIKESTTLALLRRALPVEAIYSGMVLAKW